MGVVQNISPTFTGIAPHRVILAEPNPSRMAKTTPSRAKSKTKAPKKKPTQLDRIERSIGLIESKLATLNAWETLNEAMSEAKLASQTVAVEEIKLQPLCHGDYTLASHEVAEKLTAMGFRAKSDKTYPAHEFVGWDSHSRVIEGRSGLIGKPLAQSDFLARAAVTAKELGLEPVEEKWVPKVNALAVYDGIVGMVDAHSANVGDWWSIHGRWVPTHKLSSPSPEEIAAHEAKLKAEAQAAEDAKLVFGARVECEGREWYIASITPDKGGHYLIARTDNAGLYMSWRRQRNEFTLLP